ncbi:MAG: 1-acyl-sn-glycerol-3-phosphate acyltransferase [Deltaproteobacteria bacterium]|nr:1-acyl-sn-glycerol-3-phosphate acyltransferase [Deltaproteobacteria bacterium]
MRRYHFLLDLLVTLSLWCYYTLGFVLFFAPFYFLVYCFVKERRTAFQKLNHIFYKGFFGLIKLLIPSCRWRISKAVREIRSSVIVCNHRSYIDPILLISLYAQHSTIAKARLFCIPVLGTILSLSGYIPSTARGRFADLMVDRIDGMDGFLASGGNVFIFPEGTRSRDGRIGSLNKGAFKLAKMCKAPIKVLFIENTDKLFKPGQFLFNAHRPNTVTVTLAGEMNPDYRSGLFSINGLMAEVHALLEKHVKSAGCPRL